VTAHDTVGEGLAAALIQISAHAERISGIDAREAGHYQEIGSQLRELAAEVAATGTRVAGIRATLSRQAAIVDGLHGLEAQVTALATQLADISTTAEEEDARRYQPVPQPRWWRNTGGERDAALDRLRAWVEHIYRPSYGQLAAMLPPCWEHHPLCMFTLDWLSELWSFLYLSPQRDGRALAAQGEWQTRLLPAAAEQMAYEAASCPHSRVPAGGQSPAAASARSHALDHLCPRS
jgi:hypothetical protein